MMAQSTHNHTSMHPQTNTNTQRHSDFPPDLSGPQPRTQSNCIFLVRTVHTRVSVCVCVRVGLFTSGPGRHVSHLLKGIQEGSSNHDGSPESKTNATHILLYKSIKYITSSVSLIWICTRLTENCQGTSL